MNPNVLSAAVMTAIVAILTNARGFTLLDKRIDDLCADTGRRLDRTDARLATIEADLKEFFKVQAEHDKRIQRLEDKA